MLDFIQKLLDYNSLIYYFNELMKAIFPSFVLLLVLSLKRLKNSDKNSEFIFLLSAIIVIFAARSIIFLGGISWDSNRYLYPLVVLLLVISAYGAEVFIAFFDKLFSKKTAKKAKRYSIIFFIILFTGVSIGKVFNKRTKKTYIYEVGEYIKKHNNNAKDTVLISNLNDNRIAYLANAKDVEYNKNMIFNNFKSKNIYLYLTEKDNKKLKNFKLLKTYKYKKKKFYLYYKG